jgi:hypothetical protein
VTCAPLAALLFLSPAPARAAVAFVPAAARADAFPSAARILGGAPDPLQNLAIGDPDLRDSLASAPSTAWLMAGLRSPDLERKLEAVREARGAQAIPHLSGVLLRLDEPPRVRAAAALSLGRIGSDLAVPALTLSLQDPSPEVRYASALSLGGLPADGVATLLERVLRRDPSWQVRYAAVIALGRTGKPFAAGALVAAVTGDQSWEVRQQAARSLQDLKTPRAAAALARALRDPEPSVRAAAGSALASLGGRANLRLLARARQTEAVPAVRAVLAAAERSAFEAR